MSQHGLIMGGTGARSILDSQPGATRPIWHMAEGAWLTCRNLSPATGQWESVGASLENGRQLNSLHAALLAPAAQPTGQSELNCEAFLVTVNRAGRKYSFR